MITKTRVLAAILAAMYLLSACGNPGVTSDQSSAAQSDTSQKESVPDLSVEDTGDEDDANTSEIPKVFDREDDEDCKLVANAVLEVDGKQLTFPITVQQLLDAGFVFEITEEAEEIIVPQSEQKNIETSTLYYGDNKDISVGVRINNVTDAPMTATECVVVGLNASTAGISINGLEPTVSTYSDVYSLFGADEDGRLPDPRDEVKRQEEKEYFFSFLRYSTGVINEYYLDIDTSGVLLNFDIIEDDLSSLPFGIVNEISYDFLYMY